MTCASLRLRADADGCGPVAQCRLTSVGLAVERPCSRPPPGIWFRRAAKWLQTCFVDASRRPQSCSISARAKVEACRERPLHGPYPARQAWLCCRSSRDPAREASITKLRLLLAMALAAYVACIGPAWAQDWPSRPVTVVVAFPAGGSDDILGRIV